MPLARVDAPHQDRSRRQELEVMGKTYMQALIEEGEVRGKRAASFVDGS